MIRRLAVVVVLVAAACSASDSGSTTTDAVNTPSVTVTTQARTTTTEVTTTAGETTSAPPQIPPELERFEIETVRLSGDELLVAVADDAALRQQGLMRVEDLADLDGMLFVFEEPSSGGFWMKDTLIPLDIAFFEADGTFVDRLLMTPCTTEDCPVYRPDGSYLYALEMEAGTMPAGELTLGL